MKAGIHGGQRLKCSRAEITNGCVPPGAVPGTKLRSFVRAATALNQAQQACIYILDSFPFPMYKVAAQFASHEAVWRGWERPGAP